MRFVKPLVLVLLLGALAPAAASAAPRMYVGFQDDPNFRWNENRAEVLDRAAEANATVIRTTVYWSKIAPTRPRQPTNPFDPAYRFDDLDEMVRGAEARGMEVLLTIWGTPSWAGPAQNRMPRRLADLGRFARALASRYSGRFADYPHVRFYSVWNEPNREIFLAPQYNARGRSVAPRNYARLAATAYAGLKAGNPLALVAIGETAAHGRDKRLGRRGVQETHSPGRFARLVAAAAPRLRFDAWAHHPYPTRPRMRPAQKMRWPNVSLASMPTFAKSLDKWFKRKDVRLWVTEYGHETKPKRNGIALRTQSAYAAQALVLARKNERVDMFVWFILQDHARTPWQSGLLNAAGNKKPSFARFAALARLVDARNAVVKVKGTDPLVRVSTIEFGRHSAAGAPVGVTYVVEDGGEPVAAGQPQTALGRDGWITFRPTFTPAAGKTYTLRLRAGDVHGHTIERTITLVCPNATAKR